MTHSVPETIEGYLSRLRAELTAAGAHDTDDLVAEVRSLLAEAAGGDPETERLEVERLGDPEDLAREILAERGLEVAGGMPTGVWWRLGLAAPIDIAIGLSVPVAAILPAWLVFAVVEPPGLGSTLAAVCIAASLVWPFLVWRPWRSGGRALSPGMALTGLAVVRTPGSWRLVRADELEAMGLAPRRRLGVAIAVALFAAGVLVAAVAVGLEVLGSALT